MKKRILVIGGGYDGILTAALLSKNDFLDITLVEKSSSLGGIKNSIKKGQYYFDIGCHFFNNYDDENTKIILEILKNEFIPINLKYASKYNNKITQNIISPDLRDDKNIKNIKDKIIKNILSSNLKNSSSKNLLDEYVNVFGNDVANLLANFFKKYFRYDMNIISKNSFSGSFFNKLFIFDNKDAIEYKKNPLIDQHIAVTSDVPHHEIYPNYNKKIKYKNYYPKYNGFKGFCDNAFEYLTNNNVNVILNFDVEINNENCDVIIDDKLEKFDYIIWSTDINILENKLFKTDELSKSIAYTPIVIVYFEVDAKKCSNLTYVHDYDNDYLVRISNMGIYSNQIFDGKTFLCVEIFPNADDKIFINPTDHIEEIVNIIRKNYFYNGDYIKYLYHLKTEKSYKFPKVDFETQIDILENKIINKNIIFKKDLTISADSILESVYKKIKF